MTELLVTYGNSKSWTDEILEDFTYAFEKSENFSSSTKFLDNFREISDIFSLSDSTSFEEIIHELKLKKSSEEFTKTVLKNLQAGSPTSCALTIRLFQQVQNLPENPKAVQGVDVEELQNQFALEFGMIEHCTRHPDFLEGVRALREKRPPKFDNQVE